MALSYNVLYVRYRYACSSDSVPNGYPRQRHLYNFYLQCLTNYKIPTEITKFWLKTILYSACYGYSLQIQSILSLPYVFLQFLSSAYMANYICIVCTYVESILRTCIVRRGQKICTLYIYIHMYVTTYTSA